MNTAFGHSRPTLGLVENYGPALLDRALLDALCRALGISFYQAVKTNVAGIAFPDLDMQASCPGSSRARKSPRATPSGWSIRSPRRTTRTR